MMIFLKEKSKHRKESRMFIYLIFFLNFKEILIYLEKTVMTYFSSKVQYLRQQQACEIRGLQYLSKLRNSSKKNLNKKMLHSYPRCDALQQIYNLIQTVNQELHLLLWITTAVSKFSSSLTMHLTSCIYMAYN